jgi:hypothetical protein
MKNLAISAMTLAFMIPIAFAPLAIAADSQEELAKKTNNPVANLISVPLQLDYDQNIDPTRQGDRYQLTVKPVIPISISTGWNLISRTLVPLINQHEVSPGSGTQSGIGDITQQIYFSPKAPTASGLIWGVGPQALLRTGTDNLSANKWGAGVDAVLLKQEHGWTYGVLTNHMWSFGGTGQTNISATFLQPFLSFTTKHYTTYGINTESTYEWNSRQWSVPVNMTVTQLLKIGGQALTLQAGARYWADTPDTTGPKGWGVRLTVNFLFPK